MVFQPKQMTALHLLQETIKANKRFYATWRPVWQWHKWLWTSKKRAAERKKAYWDRMLEYGWLWYYSRTWWTAAKNRAQRRRLRELSKRQPLPAAQAPRPAAPTVVAEACTTAAEAGGADNHLGEPARQQA